MAKKKIYAVRKGHKTGLFETWAECQKATSGYSGAEFRGFTDREEAMAFLQMSTTANVSKDEEKEAIKDEKEYQVGIDALTIAVNPANPVNDVLDNLTTEQIVGLFSGEYATWKDLDSSLPDEEVVVITRDINGGAHEVFQKNIMGDTEVKADAIQASSMGELVQDIIDNQYAIGYASFGVANQNEGKVTPLKVNGVAATKENILDGSYIIQRPLLLVGSGDTTDVQQAFLDYVLGYEGQKTVEDMGFIPMK